VATSHIKRRDPAAPGTIPDRLQMFAREVRFYREVAPTIGIRVPGCLRAEVDSDGFTLLELEDLSTWRPGADPVTAAKVLREMHSRWESTAVQTWPWLPRHDVSDLVEDLFAVRWPTIRARADVTPQTRQQGDSLVGGVRQAERESESAGSPTLIHGDASRNNMRTSPSGEVALLDWEDFGVGPGVCDLAWFLVSSVHPREWDAAIGSYGSSDGLDRALPAAIVQALLSLDAEEEGSPDATARMTSLAEARHWM